MLSCRYGKHLAQGGNTAHLTEQVGFVLVCGRKKRGATKLAVSFIVKIPAVRTFFAHIVTKPTRTYTLSTARATTTLTTLALCIMLSHCLLSTGLTSWPRLPVTSKNMKCTGCPVSSSPEALR